MNLTPFTAQCILIMSSFDKIEPSTDRKFYLMQQRLFNNAFCCLLYSGAEFTKNNELITIALDKEYSIPINTAKNIMGTDTFKEIIEKNTINNEKNDVDTNKNEADLGDVKSENTGISNIEDLKINDKEHIIDEAINIEAENIEKISSINENIDIGNEIDNTENDTEPNILIDQGDFDIQETKTVDTEKKSNLPEDGKKGEENADATKDIEDIHEEDIKTEATDKQTEDTSIKQEDPPKKVFMPKKIESKEEKSEENIEEKAEETKPEAFTSQESNGFIPKIEHNLILKARYSQEEITGYKIVIFPIKIMEMTAGIQAFRGLVYFESPDGERQLQFKDDNNIEITFKHKEKEFGVTARWFNNIIETSVFAKGDTFSKYDLTDNVIDNCKGELTKSTLSPFMIAQKGRPTYYVFPLSERNTENRTVPIISCIKTQSYMVFLPKEDGCTYYNSRKIPFKIVGSWQDNEFKFSIDEVEA